MLCLDTNTFIVQHNILYLSMLFSELCLELNGTKKSGLMAFTYRHLEKANNLSIMENTEPFFSFLYGSRTNDNMYSNGSGWKGEQ